MKKYTCNDFMDILNNDGFFSQIHSEMFFNKSFNANKVFEKIKKEALKRNIELSDVNDWDFEKDIYENYNNDSDKGLS